MEKTKILNLCKPNIRKYENDVYFFLKVLKKDRSGYEINSSNVFDSFIYICLTRGMKKTKQVARSLIFYYENKVLEKRSDYFRRELKKIMDMVDIAFDIDVRDPVLSDVNNFYKFFI